MIHKRSLSRERRAWADWLMAPKNKWLYFATLTYRDHIHYQDAYQGFREFCRKLAQEMNAHLKIAYGCEPQLRGVFHFHAAIGEVEYHRRLLDPDNIQRLWSDNGNAKVELWNNGKGGLYYIAEHRIYNDNLACPRWPCCRRKEGCRLAAAPWPKEIILE